MKLLNALSYATIILSLSVACYGAKVISVIITATGGAPIPIAYDASDSQSLVLDGTAQSRNHIIIDNNTSDDIAVSVDGSSSAVAPSNDVHDIYVRAGQVKTLDQKAIGGRVYLRSDEVGTITTGTVLIETW